MPKIATVSVLVGALMLPLLGSVASGAPNDGAAVGPHQRLDPKTKAWFDHTIEHMLDESSSIADARQPAR